MTSALSDPTFGTGAAVGRYFGVVSAMPSLLLTVYTFLLLASGAWSHEPSLAAIGDTIGHFSVAQGVALVALALVLALALHGLQLGMVQFLEGYWGGNPLARAVRSQRVRAHRARLLAVRAAAADLQTRTAAIAARPDSPQRTRDLVDANTSLADLHAVESRYPDGLDEVMATRLGNVLRKYESYAGRAYGLSSITIAPHLTLVAPERHVSYLNDQRSQLDLAARLCATCLLATVATATLMWPWGWWLLTAAIPYVLAYLSYRGTVAAAGDYGIALMTIVDLNRFALYDALRIEQPTNSAAERVRNQDLNALLGGMDEDITYTHP